MTNFTYPLDPIEDLKCQLSSGKSCASETVSHGLQCVGYGNSVEYNCDLNSDIQNETSYTCFKCAYNSLDSSGNYTVCSSRLELKVVGTLYESAVKNLWLKIPDLDICDWNTLSCSNDSNRTLYIDALSSVNSLSLNESFQCRWDMRNDTGSFISVEYDWSFLFVIFFIVAGGVGNILVCLAVCLDKRLQNVTNYFLLSLAIADLLVSLFVMPMGAIPGFLGKSIIPYLHAISNV